jgi:uncharacterized repeat protein (TIGR01451 family)
MNKHQVVMSRRLMIGTGATLLLILAMLIAVLPATSPADVALAVPASIQDQHQQLQNKVGSVEWANGNINSSNSDYWEGDVVPYRYEVINLPGSTDVYIEIHYDFTKGGKHAFDFLANYNLTESVALASVGGVFGSPATPLSTLSESDNHTQVQIPLDSSVPGDDALAPQYFDIYGDYTSAVVVGGPTLVGSVTGDSEKYIKLKIHTNSSTGADRQIALAWGGHLATEGDWGGGLSSSCISGAPFHQNIGGFVDANGNGEKDGGEKSLGAGDRSIQMPKPDLSLTKDVDDATPNVGQDVIFTIVVTNNGPDVTVATGVTVKDILPSCVTYKSDDGGGDYNPVTGIWTVNPLPGGGGSDTLHITATVNAAGSCENCAEVWTCNQPDSDSTPGNCATGVLEDDCDCVTITVPQVDLSLTKGVNNPTPDVGQDVIFTIVVSNGGPDGATGVTVKDILPSCVTYKSDDGGGKYNSGTGIWDVGSLANGGSATLHITATVNAAGSCENCAEVWTCDQADIDSTPGNGLAEDDRDCATLNGQEIEVDLSLTKGVNNPTPDVGQDVIFTIVVSNGGPAEATGVTVKDILPSCVTYKSDDGGGKYDSGTGIWDVGSLANGGSATLHITATVNAAGSCENCAEVWTCDQADSDSTPGNCATKTEDDCDCASLNGEETEVDLSLTKGVNNPTPDVGQNVIFTIVVSNGGPAEATGVTVKDILPGCLSYVTSSATQGSYNSATHIWDVGSLANGGSATLHITATVTTAGVCVNWAEVWTCDQPDSDSTPGNCATKTEDDCDSATIAAAVSVTDVAVRKSDNPDPLTAGYLLTYTITVTNYGPLTATGVLLTDDIPDELLDPEYSLDGGSTWNPWTGSLNLGTIAAGGSRVVLIRGTVDPSFIGLLCNTAVVSSTTPDSNLANNRDMECTNVIAPPPGCTLELTCPADVTIQCGESTDPSNTGWATAIGNCNPEVTYSDSISGTCPTIVTRTWTATDDSGNVANCIQIITVVDNTPPVLTVPADVVVGYGEPTDPAHTGWATATDNCDPNPEVTYSDSWCWVCCSDQLTRTWTATDACGNSTSAVQKITAPDNTPPVLTVPPDVTLEYGMGLPPANTGEATAIDNRDPSPTIVYRDSYSGTCPTIITRTWIATDGSGNMASAVQMITLVDTTAPELTVPADITIGFGQSTSPFNTGGWATAIDNFDPSPEIAYSDSFSGTCPVTITRTWTATDCCGNSASTVQRITVVDTTPPVLNVPASVAIEYGQSTAPADLGWATAVDNFDPSPEIAYSDSSSGTYPTVITRTWTATDSCGNSASAVQTLTLVDTTRPVLTLPADITIGKGESTAPSHTGWATATDIADPSPVITYVDSVSVDHISRVWTATDASDNSASGIQVITISGGGFPLWAIALIALAGFLLTLLLVVLLGRRERRAPGGLM